MQSKSTTFTLIWLVIDFLLGSMLIFFSWGHLPITILHPPELVFPAMEWKYSSAPLKGLFWIADHKWSRPGRLTKAVIAMGKMRNCPIIISFMFAFTCMVAFCYTRNTFPCLSGQTVKNATSITPFTFSLGVADVDQDTWIGLGLNSGATGLYISSSE